MPSIGEQSDKLQWITAIRADIMYQTKGLARHLHQPTRLQTHHLKHLLRYLSGTKHYAAEIKPERQKDRSDKAYVINGYTDSDWGSCQETRKSTSGLVIKLEGATIAVASRTQSTVAQSSGEAELYAIGSGCSESLYIRSFLHEWHEEMKVALNMHTESSVAKSWVSRKGLSKRNKHLDIRYLYLQDLIQKGVIRMIKIPRSKPGRSASQKCAIS